MRGNDCPAIFLALTMLIHFAGHAYAGEGCCAQCGRTGACQKVCRVVSEDRKIETVCWGYQCEDFCVPGRSKPGCRHCETVCGSCPTADDPEAPFAKPKKSTWTNWFPGSAHVYTKKKLMKKVVTRTVPGSKWVVEDLCTQCAANCRGVEVQPGAKVPPSPVVDARPK